MEQQYNLCSKLDDGAASVMRSRHLILITICQMTGNTFPSEKLYTTKLLWGERHGRENSSMADHIAFLALKAYLSWHFNQF